MVSVRVIFWAILFYSNFLNFGAVFNPEIAQAIYRVLVVVEIMQMMSFHHL